MKLLPVSQRCPKKKTEEKSCKPTISACSVKTFSIFRIPIELLFDENEYRLKGPCVSSMAIKEVACAQDLARWINSHFF
jgi:hypothetical protein